MIVRGKPITVFIQNRAFDLRQKRSGLVGQIAADDHTGAAVSVKVLGALDQITRSGAPNPAMLYEITRLAARILQPLNESGTNEVIPIKLHDVFGVERRFGVLPSGPQFN